MSLLTDKTMREQALKELFWEWCPNDCRDRKKDPLTDEERAGCVASGGFAEEAIALEVAGVPLSELIEKAESGELVDKGALLMRFAEWALTLEHDEWMIAAEDIDRMKAGLEPEGMWIAAKALKGECLLCDHKAEGGDDYCEGCRLAIDTEQQHEEDELTRHQGV